jgi:hypothetical protein
MQFRFGRRRPVVRYPHFRMSRYLATAPVLPAPPQPPLSYATAASAALEEMYSNDQLGDCVIAGMQHIDGVLTGNAGGLPVIYSDAQTVNFYAAACGYRGTEATDNGCDIQTVLAYAQNNGIAADARHRIAGWLAVDPFNQNEIQTAIWLFENLVFGIELPDAWLHPEPSESGFVWDVAGEPNPENGHCVVGIGYTAEGVTISTWGMTGTITWAAVAKYCGASANGELFTIISKDALSGSQLGAAGFDWSQMVADFDALGGTVAA